MSVPRILLVDDDRDFLSRAEATLTRGKYQVLVATDIEKAAGILQRLRGRSVVLCELAIPGASTLGFLKSTLRSYPFVPFTVMARSPSLESVIEALKQGAYDFLRKPVDPEILFHSVARSVEKLDLTLESEKQEKEIRDLLSRNRARIKELDALCAFKSFMISMAAHDFKSIITVLDGYYQVIKEHSAAGAPAISSNLLVQAGRSITRLHTMASTLLDYEAAQRGQLRLQLREFNLEPLIRESLSFYQPYAEQKKVALSFETAPAALKARGDPARVMQVLDNVLYNAIKFTPSRGEIRIGARAEEERRVTVWVADTGIGIPKTRLKKLMAGGSVLSKNDAGSRIGLGIDICRKLLEIQNGRIWLESAPGKGTKVFFSLPM